MESKFAGLCWIMYTCSAWWGRIGAVWYIPTLWKFGIIKIRRNPLFDYANYWFKWSVSLQIQGGNEIFPKAKVTCIYREQ
jgi:hypothetical protein